MATILVIEDEIELLTNLRELLEAEGYEVWTAQGVSQALSIVFSSTPDLVLSDLKMGVTGEEGLIILGRMTQDRVAKEIPFVLLTAIADRRSIIKAMRLGASDYIIKPYTIEEVLGSIKSCLEARKHRQQVLEPRYFIYLTATGIERQTIALESIHTIGRLPNCTTRVNDPRVSRVSCTLQKIKKARPKPYYQVIDGQITPQGARIPSANGIRVNGEKIEVTQELKNGDRIHLSPTTYLDYEVISEEEESNEPQTLI